MQKSNLISRVFGKAPCITVLKNLEKSDENKLATLPATVTLPPEPWEETEKEFGARLKAVASWANHHHDVEGLCKEMPQRMHDFVDHPSKNPRAGPAMA